MVTKVIMPQMGLTMEEGKIVEWLKKEGERVEKGEALFQIETDKVTLEVESPGTGLLAQDPGQGRGDRPHHHRDRLHRRGE